MGEVFLDMAVSLDGFICGPNGEDGGLHDWYFAPQGAATEIKEELLATIGAIVLGRRAFGSAPDGFDTPYGVPHFILTHEVRGSAARGGASFHFVTSRADVARQALAAGLLDELQLHVVPVLLGGGLRLFEHLGTGPVGLERLHVVEGAGVTHLGFRVVK